MNHQNRRLLREPFLSGSHLLGALCGLIGILYLTIYCCGDTSKILIVSVYGLTLIGLLLTSGIFHGIHGSVERIQRLERLDYIFIYLFIAGTYTPLCLFTLEPVIGMRVLILEWTLALIGVYSTIRWGFSSKLIQIGVYLIMGWIFLFTLQDFFKSLNESQLMYLFIGAGFYSIGSLIFAFAPKHVLKSQICTHSIWHLFVLAGATSHYLVIYQILVP